MYVYILIYIYTHDYWILGPLGKLWGYVVTYGDIWKYMEMYGGNGRMYGDMWRYVGLRRV